MTVAHTPNKNNVQAERLIPQSSYLDNKVISTSSIITTLPVFENTQPMQQIVETKFHAYSIDFQSQP